METAEAILLYPMYVDSPWVEWTSLGEGHMPGGSIMVDGQPVPAFNICCGSTISLPHDEDCMMGVEWNLPLENGLFAVVVVTEKASSVWVTYDTKDFGELHRTETGVCVDQVCSKNTCPDPHCCIHTVTFDHTDFKTRDELMSKVAEWSSWEVEGR